MEAWHMAQFMEEAMSVRSHSGGSLCQATAIHLRETDKFEYHQDSTKNLYKEKGKKKGV